jgi:hypothetical protein
MKSPIEFRRSVEPSQPRNSSAAIFPAFDFLEVFLVLLGDLRSLKKQKKKPPVSSESAPWASFFSQTILELFDYQKCNTPAFIVLGQFYGGTRPLPDPRPNSKFPARLSVVSAELVSRITQSSVATGEQPGLSSGQPLAAMRILKPYVIQGHRITHGKP